jgi:hypothetical protein
MLGAGMITLDGLLKDLQSSGKATRINAWARLEPVPAALLFGDLSIHLRGSINGVFSHFRLADRYAHAPVLGWTLSKRSQVQIDGERIHMGSRIIARLQRLLSGS